MGMEWQSVESSQLDEIGYDEETQEAQVRFANGSVYAYDGVPKDVVDGIVSAGSPGREFNQTLKFGYPYKRIA